MKHFNSITKNAPAEASILTWGGAMKAALGPYASALFNQWDNRTADTADGDIGDPDTL